MTHVVLPVNAVKRDRVHVLIKDDGQRNREVENRETLCTQGIRENFNGIGDDERCKSNAMIHQSSIRYT